jgi:alkaline phosphatase
MSALHGSDSVDGVKRILLVLLIAGPSLLLAQAPVRARNVILFLADAAGIPTLNAASIHGYGAPRRLFIQRMPYIALSETSTASQFVTDSAAGMTAIVTGVRTHNGVIAQAADAVRGKKDGTPLKTILEHSEEHGLATGIISNDSLAGATPATLYAKSNDRNKTADIFQQAFLSRFGDGVDVMIGAGRSNIVKALAAQGRTLDALEREHRRPILDSLQDVDRSASRAIVLIDDQEFDLAMAVRRAVEMLSRNPNGYFLMVESDAHTDSIRHGLDRVVTFDRVIEQMASTLANDTLLLFTADHSFDLRVYAGQWGKPLLSGAAAETDGGAISVRLPSVRMDDDHTGEEVLVAAQGPGGERVRGYMANTDLFTVMMAAFGWTMPSTR